jgi:hypothetical protein
MTLPREIVNKNLNHWEQIQKYYLVTNPISIESGELTPSMKLKRNFVEEKYQSVIDKFYDEAGRSILDLLKGEGGPAKIAEVFKTAGADVQQSFSNIKQSITSIDFKAAIQPYVSSGNKIAEAADLAVTGLKNLAAKATASGTMTNKADANQSQSSNNQTIKVEDINYKGAIEIKVTTPNGNTSNLTDTQVYDLFKNETFIKQINKMISDGSVKGPYSSVPNNTR